MSRTASFPLIALLVATPSLAQDKEAEIDRIFSFATAEAPGCATAVSQQGKVVANRAYGLANVERTLPLTERSRFDIGSVQKQFTAAAILLLAEQGRLSLTDDIRKHLPELPEYGHTITIDHLLTHTGGIRDWTGLLPMAPEGTEVLPLILRQRGLNSVPGTEFSYSNSGFELAKEIVARVSGMSFADFTRRRLFEPLGMTSSAYVPDILHAGTDAALAYQKDGGGWKPFMRLGNNRAGGAIASTVGDLVTWNDAVASGKLSRFVTEKLHEPAKLNNGRTLKYARGLFVDHTPGGLVIAASGGAAGFSTWTSRFPEHGVTVAVACNFEPVSATALGGRVADLYLPPLPDAVRAEAVAAGSGATGVDVSMRPGLFFEERTGEPLRLVENQGRLRIANGPPLVPLAQDRFRASRPELFFRSQDAFELTFPSNDRLEIRSMEGDVTRYRRARPWTPTAADLQAVEGRYMSAELGSVFEIVPGANNIVMRAEGSPERAITLAPVDSNTYMLSMMVVRFQRDAGGRVTALEYGNPVVRNIGFTRLGDRAASGAPPARVPVTKEAAPASPAAGPASAAIAAPPLEGLVGEYELVPGRSITITLENGQLHGEPTGNPKQALVHRSGATFDVATAPISVTFVVDGAGRATAMVMRQNGNERTLRKVR